MKMTRLKITTIAAAVALVSAITACQNKGTEAAAPAKETKTDAAVQGPEIVYVDSDSLLANYKYFKDLKVKMDSKAKSAQSDMGAKAQAFQREVAQYQQQQGTLSADQRASTEERLARKQQELQAYQQNAGAALQTETAKEQEKLYDKVADYLKVYAKKKGYKMVLTYAKGNSAILFADNSLDVTKEVIAGLNEAYTSDKP